MAAALVVAGCGGSPVQPTLPGPVLAAVSPSRGPAAGGTALKITGANFSAGATVAIGGVNATDVVVESSTSIAAKTAPRSAGTADVAVTVAGKTAVLPAAFQYEAIQSAAPVVTALVARGAKHANQPVGLADLDEEITVTATVQDPDTPVDQLTYEWGAPTGTFSGTGPSVKWRAPAAASVPIAITLTVTVLDPANRVTATTTVNLHDSATEIGKLARDFLLDFSDSAKSPAVVVRNFSTSARCAKTRQDELDDVADNRRFYRIESSDIGPATVHFGFGGRPCRVGAADGDACAVIRAEWQSRCLETNEECVKDSRPRVAGIDYVTAVYEQPEWRLCASNFGPLENIFRPRFIR